jgi:hypothetical protein
MELPDILNKITHSEEKGKVEYFWALQIWDEGVKSAIWTVIEGQTKILALGSSEIWDGTDENLIIAVDKSIGKAMESFIPDKEEPSKAIFGLPNDWSSIDSKISPEKLNQLQNLCKQLEFKPIGFVATFDAINHRLKDLEGMPPTVILVNPWQQYVNVSLIEVGKSLGVEKIVRSHNLAADVYEGLLHFEGIEAMPSRILLFNGHELEEASQVLIAYPWQSSSAEGGKLPFFHLPKIEILPYDFDITAVVLSGGREVAKSLGYEVNQESENVPVVEEPSVPKAVEELTSEKMVEPESGDFGFVKGQDIVTLNQPKVETVIQDPVADSLPQTVDDYSFSGPETNQLPPKSSKFKFKLPSFKIPSFSGFSLASRLPMIGLLILLIVVVFGIGIGFYWYNMPKAEIVLYVAAQPLGEDFEILVDANQETLDTGNMILPAQVKETQLTGESSVSTTGEKTIGEKSKGPVTIYNLTDNKKVFSEGTVIVGPGGLKFTLDQETTIASRSFDLLSTPPSYKFGESKTTITAVDIGAQYNLATNSLFLIKDNPQTSFLAKNEEVITGGTSRQIQAVSEKDQKDLLDQLNKDLFDKGKIELASEILSDENLIEESLNNVVESAVYDRKIGEEAQNLSLKLTVKIAGLSYQKDNFAILAESKLKDSIPEGFSFKKEETTGRFEVVKKNSDGSILFKVYVSSNLLPKVAIADIISNVKGKNKAVALKYLGSISGVTGSEINLKPELPGFLKTVPRRENLIFLEVRSR